MYFIASLQCNAMNFPEMGLFIGKQDSLISAKFATVFLKVRVLLWLKVAEMLFQEAHKAIPLPFTFTFNYIHESRAHLNNYTIAVVGNRWLVV